MGQRTGSADLPLHGGRVPPWLALRMARLGRVLIEALILEHGRAEVLRRLAHPFWFQSLGCVMGMDWHSSGITTSVLGALKRGLAPVADELGLYVCGGRGRMSRQTPDELLAVGERTGLDGAALAHKSRIVAKVDSAAVQDGFELYLHGFIVAADGAWTVVQQGMNGDVGTARRYHWLSEGLTSFVEEPHAAIDGVSTGAAIINLTDRRAARARAAQVALVAGGPDLILRELPRLIMPSHHDVRRQDVILRRLHGALTAAAARGPVDFQDVLMTPGVGARTIASVAAVAEVIYGTPSRFTDPARFALAHGGKDGHPFPVPLKVYDRTIAIMRRAVDEAKLGNEERLAAVRRLDGESRRVERWASGPSFDAYVADERRQSHRYGGMTVMGPARPGVPTPLPEKMPPLRSRRAAPAQLELPLSGRASGS